MPLPPCIHIMEPRVDSPNTSTRMVAEHLATSDPEQIEVRFQFFVHTASSVCAYTLIHKELHTVSIASG